VPQINRWGAWGRQRGVDLTKLAECPDIDGIICETYRPLAGGLDSFVAEYARITRAAGKTFGVMLHRDDSWPLDLAEEERRWALINRVAPTVIARYPCTHILRAIRSTAPPASRCSRQGSSSTKRMLPIESHHARRLWRRWQ
jgi:hypothetical protein